MITYPPIVYKPPKKWKSWRVCPKCGSKATKILSVNTGLYTCQICDHEYNDPRLPGGSKP